MSEAEILLCLWASKEVWRRVRNGMSMEEALLWAAGGDRRLVPELAWAYRVGGDLSREYKLLRSALFETEQEERAARLLLTEQGSPALLKRLEKPGRWKNSPVARKPRHRLYGYVSRRTLRG